MFRVLISFGVVVALVFAVLGFWNDSKDDFAAPDHEHALPTLQQIAADGAFDNDLTLWNEDTTLAVIDSVRPLLLLYADSDDKLVGKDVVAGLIVSNDYVITTSLVIPDEETGVYLGAAFLLPIPEDPTSTVEPLGAPTALDKVLGLVAFPRPEPSGSAVPLTLGAGDEASTTAQLLAPVAHLLINEEAELPAGLLTVHPAGHVAWRAAGDSPVFLVNPLPAGTPLFALRDGVPEFVGMLVEVDEQLNLSVVITTDLIENYLQHLGILGPSPR